VRAYLKLQQDGHVHTHTYTLDDPWNPGPDWLGQSLK
jgi:hypothetical protein